MTDEERSALLAWGASLPPTWYVDHPNAARAAERLAARLKLPEHYERGDCPLTTRQREILWLLANGKTVPEAAEWLGIDFETAAWHLRMAKFRLKTKGYTRAVAIAIRRGWI